MNAAEIKILQLEESLEIANEKIERLMNRRENLDMVIEKTQQLEKTFYDEMNKHRILANKVQSIDEEHARMFLMSERIGQRADVFSLQYSSIEEGMGYVLKSMRRHDENIRTVNDNASNLRLSLVKRIDDHIYETKKTLCALEKQLEEKTDNLDTQLWFKLRVLEEYMQSSMLKESEMLEKINKLVAEIEKPKQEKPKQEKQKWKGDPPAKYIKFHDEFPSL